MQPIGYNKSQDEKSEKEIKTLEELEKFLQTDVRRMDMFEKVLKLELRGISDITSNLRHLGIQIESIKKLLQQFESISSKLGAEQAKRRTELNIEECRKYIQMLRMINYQLTPMIQKTGSELQKLFVDETAIIYSNSQKNKEIMEKVNQEARAMSVEISQIFSLLSTRTSEIEDFGQWLDKLQAERNARPALKNKIGY